MPACQVTHGTQHSIAPDLPGMPANHRGLIAPRKPGQSGNPAGRPKGSRNKLGEQFIADLYDDWRLHGPEVLEAARREKPADYLKVIAAILPRDVKVSVTDTMSGKELDARINLLTGRMGLKLVPADTAVSLTSDRVIGVPDSLMKQTALCES